MRLLFTLLNGNEESPDCVRRKTIIATLPHMRSQRLLDCAASTKSLKIHPRFYVIKHIYLRNEHVNKAIDFSHDASLPIYLYVCPSLSPSLSLSPLQRQNECQTQELFESKTSEIIKSLFQNKQGTRRDEYSCAPRWYFAALCVLYFCFGSRRRLLHTFSRAWAKGFKQMLAMLHNRWTPCHIIVNRVRVIIHELRWKKICG